MQVENDKLSVVVPISSEVHIFNISLEEKKKKEKEIGEILYLVLAQPC